MLATNHRVLLERLSKHVHYHVGSKSKGNADTERAIRTIKENLVWPNEFATPFELQSALDKWMNDYNADFPYPSIGYKTPCEFEQKELSKTL